MTTKITVDAHAGWPVEVKAYQRPKAYDNGQVHDLISRVVVAANTRVDVHCWDNVYLVIREMRKEEAPQPPKHQPKAA